MKTFDVQDIALLAERARQLPRRRTNLNIHETTDDPVSRFLNVAQPGSYVRPHFHGGNRWELVTLLSGALDMVVFDDAGAIQRRVDLSPGQNIVVELQGGEWHSLVFRTIDTVLLEVKPGPWIASTDKYFAEWAPEEGDAMVPAFLEWLAVAPIGSRWGGGGSFA